MGHSCYRSGSQSLAADSRDFQSLIYVTPARFTQQEVAILAQLLQHICTCVTSMVFSVAEAVVTYGTFGSSPSYHDHQKRNDVRRIIADYKSWIGAKADIRHCTMNTTKTSLFVFV